MSDNGIGTRLRQRRLDRGLTIEQLASRAGVGVTSIQRYETGVNSPTYVQLEKIAAALGCTIGQLDKEIRVSERPASYGETDTPRAVHSVDLPLYETVPAGGWSNLDVEANGTFPVLHHIASEGRVVVRVHGTSMYPTLHDGDLILVDTTRAAAKSGEIVLATHNGQCTLKRFRRAKRQILLTADNPAVPPVEIEDAGEVELLGVATRLVDRDISKVTW